MEKLFSSKDRDALIQEIFSILHCALPGNVVSFDAEKQTAKIQPAMKLGSMTFPVLTDVPVFMPVPFDVHPGDACLVVFSDVDIDGWFEYGEPLVPRSARKHSLSDGFAFVGFRTPGNRASVPGFSEKRTESAAASGGKRQTDVQ